MPGRGHVTYICLRILKGNEKIKEMGTHTTSKITNTKIFHLLGFKNSLIVSLFIIITYLLSLNKFLSKIAE